MFYLGLADTTINDRTLKFKVLAAFMIFFPCINFLMKLFK